MITVVVYTTFGLSAMPLELIKGEGLILLSTPLSASAPCPPREGLFSRCTLGNNNNNDDVDDEDDVDDDNGMNYVVDAD